MLLHTDTPHEAEPLPPPRDQLPTLPCDLSEYAERETGPRSWSARACGDLSDLTLAIDPFDLFAELSIA
jgi:hypothetical protein